MKLVVGSDHAGFPLKASVVEYLQELGHEITDVGSYNPAPVDFPVISGKVCDAVLDGSADRGLLICGTGVGAVIAANKRAGIRASIGHDVHCAHQGVEHDDVNVMCIGAQIVGPWLARDLVKAYVEAEFNATDDHVRRVEMLHELDRTRGA